MSRTLKVEARYFRSNAIGVLLAMIAAIILGDIIVALIMAFADDAKAGVPLGGMFACMILFVFAFLSACTSATRNFNIAVYMGQTRRDWLVASCLSGLICMELLTVIVIGLVFLERHFLSYAYPTLPIEGEITMASLRWFFPGLPFIMSLGMLSGILALRFGRAMIWIYTTAWVVFCLNMERAFRLGITAFGPIIDRIAAATGRWFYLSAALIFLLLAAGVMAVNWMLLRRQMAA